MRRRRRYAGLGLCLVAILIVAACERRGDSPATPPEKPARNGLESIGPDHESRIYYQFIDEQHRVRFVERLADVPERWRDRAGFVELDSPPPLTPGDARRTREERTRDIRAREPARNTPVVRL